MVFMNTKLLKGEINYLQVVECTVLAGILIAGI